MKSEGVARLLETTVMSSIGPTTASKQAAWLEQRIKEHREEVERLREQIGDPEEALSRFVRDRFEGQALVPDGWPRSGVSTVPWEADDDSDAW
jgi:hypothetical protein